MKESTKKLIAFCFATAVLIPIGIWAYPHWFGFGIWGIMCCFFIGDWIKRARK